MGLTALLNGCQSVQIPDVQFIGSLGPNGAVTFDLLDSSTEDLTLQEFAQEWNDLADPKGPLVCMHTQDWASVKADLETLCSWISGGCTLQQQQAMTNFMARVNSLKEGK